MKLVGHGGSYGAVV